MSSFLQQTLSTASSKLTERGFETALLDAEILLAHIIKKPKEFLYTDPEYPLTKRECAAFQKLIARRLSHEPIAYIINKKEFYGYSLFVDARVLIPRPETETVVEQSLSVLAQLSPNKKIAIADIGTGSGCIIISIARELFKKALPQSFALFAVDSSKNALAVAKRNARSHQVFKHISFLRGNLLEPLAQNPLFIAADHCIVIANLPYITPKIFKTLVPEITRFEPRDALITPTNDPDYWYKKIEAQIERLKTKTKTKWHIIFERA